MGYHDPAWFEIVEGGITTWRLPVRDVAMAATSMLVAQITNRDPSASLKN